MNKLIEKIFESEGLIRHPTSDLELYKYSQSGKTNYWLIIHDAPTITAEQQAAWLNICKSATTDPALEKNINLLIVWKTDSASILSSKEVHHAEEDCYFFKKHVLPYTVDEFEALQQQIISRGFDIVFRQDITAPHIFAQYKSHYLAGGWQSLLYRLAIKLPFIAIHSSGNTDLENLQRSIHGKIQRTENSDELIATESIVHSLAEQIASADILPEELLLLIEKKLAEAGHETDR
ncbi:hypothetical protein NOX22_13980 [Enterobacter cloacae]|uniref:ABC-three component system middle component 1 n=1 Tax=Enterobacter cloacae complex TaxID=354276 RepID=UPI00210A2DC7|nr:MULTISPECIES: ABC-three component system middle component 1 [Enterobacter cloacae complex]MCQ4445691.1 hypothetical protein [Enterobacter cloacae]MDW2869276.1 ABC-three component system middle component 1 [Enterobacter hormaechei]